MRVRRDEEDSKNALLEVRSGSGGDEAAAFAKELFEMYRRFAELKGWEFEELHRSVIDAGEHGPNRLTSARSAHTTFSQLFVRLSSSDACVWVFDRRFLPLYGYLFFNRPVLYQVYN